MLGLSRSALRIDLSSSRLDKPFYTTLDNISGRVVFAPHTPVEVHDVLIDFVGTTVTWMDPSTPGTPRRKALFEFLKMSDDQDIRQTKTVSQTQPLELPFTFVVPRELLPVSCKCPSSVDTSCHLHLPPTVGNWDNSDDLSPDMYPHPGPHGTNGRAKIEYKIRVKVITKVAGKKVLVEEASEPLQVLPLYSWWENRHPGTPTYEEVQSSSGQAIPTPSLKTTRVEKMLKKGFLGKKRGLLSLGIECPESYEVSVGGSEPVKTALSIPIQMQYSPITADLPPKISLLSAKLLARTNFNVDSGHDRRNKGVYSTGVTLLKPSTPSCSTPLWLEDCSSSNLTFVSNLLVPISLLPAAGTKTAKGEKVLLPSFESCLISRSYQIEVRIGFEGGSDVMAHVPVSIRAKPLSAEAERDLENAIRIANDWVPPEQEVMVGNLEPELLRPTIQTLRLNDTPTSDDDGTSNDLGVQESAPVVRTIQLPVGLPPDYEVLVSSQNDKGIVEKRITARAA